MTNDRGQEALSFEDAKSINGRAVAADRRAFAFGAALSTITIGCSACALPGDLMYMAHPSRRAKLAMGRSTSTSPSTIAVLGHVVALVELHSVEQPDGPREKNLCLRSGKVVRLAQDLGRSGLPLGLRHIDGLHNEVDACLAVPGA